jgi:hypothetical protein
VRQRARYSVSLRAFKNGAGISYSVLHKRLLAPLRPISPTIQSTTRGKPPVLFPFSLPTSALNRLILLWSLLLLTGALPPCVALSAAVAYRCWGLRTTLDLWCRRWGKIWTEARVDLSRGRRCSYCCLRSLRYGFSDVSMLRLLLSHEIDLQRFVSHFDFPLSSFLFWFLFVLFLP